MNYIIWLAIFIWTPTLIMWHRHFNLLWRYRITLLHAIFFAFVFSIPWDILTVKHNIWFFPKEGNLGIYLGCLPIEEYLFMATVTLFVATIMIILKYKGKLKT